MSDTNALRAAITAFISPVDAGKREFTEYWIIDIYAPPVPRDIAKDQRREELRAEISRAGAELFRLLAKHPRSDSLAVELRQFLNSHEAGHYGRLYQHWDRLKASLQVAAEHTVEPAKSQYTGQEEGEAKDERCEPALGNLPERARLAYLQHRQAIRALVEEDSERSEDDITDDSAYQHLKVTEVGKLPSRDTWKRNLRTARNAISQQKKKRRPKYDGRSAVRPEHFGNLAE